MLTAAVAVVLLVGLPLVELLRTTLEGGPAAAWTALSTSAGLRAVVNTLWTGGVVTVAAVTAGTAAAVVTERMRAPARHLLRLAMLLPLVTPGFVAALSWARAYGPSGLSDDLLGVSLPGLFGPGGVVVVLTVEALPLAYLVVAAALASRHDADAERAARMSGATPAQTLRTVTLPLLRPALMAAGALAFVTTINAFGVPAVLGAPARFTTITTRIYQDLARSADPAAFVRAIALSTALVLLAAAVVSMADLAGARRTAVRGPAASACPTNDGPRWPGVALWTGLWLVAGIPLIALGLAAVTRAAGLAPVPMHWTLGNFREALQPAAVAALSRTLAVSALAATAVVMLAALLVMVRGTRSGRVLGTAATLTFAVPGSALAVAMLLAYGPWLRDTLMLILLAYVAKFWALGYRPLDGAAGAVPPDLLRAARASGADAAMALRTIAIPLLRPSLAAAWLIVFLFGLHELTMSSLLYGPGSLTLAVVILNVTQLGDVTVTSALAVMLTAAVLLLSALLIPLRGSRRA